MTDCLSCGAGTWAAVNSRFGSLCLSCLYRTRKGGIVVAPKLRRDRVEAPVFCRCAIDEACDVCYAAKEAAMDATV